MYIEDRLFSESEQEVYYSVVLDEEEMELLRLFSKYEDEDFEELHEKRKKEATKNRKWGTVGAAAVGALLGGGVAYDQYHHNPLRPKLGKRMAIGAAVGAAGIGALSHYLGKKEERRIHRESNKDLDRYRHASEADKAYLRKRADSIHRDDQDKKQRKAMRDSAYIAGSLSGLSRW